MNVGIGSDAVQFLFRENINWIIGTVCDTAVYLHNFLS